MLDNINYPNDIKKLTIPELKILADDIRNFIINSVSKTGGHLASNLGVIEISIALHYVFNTPNDSIVWDVGHQTYAHKILSGRKDQMHTIRQYNGLSGFSNIKESKFDSFGAGHSSTSISAALGIAVANKINNSNDKTIAVIGDGALTGGMSFEALNNAGDIGKDILIVINDNEMSISKNVGALSKHLTKMISSKTYAVMKHKSMQILAKTPRIKKLAQFSEERFKGMLLPSSNFFEELGIEYFGPIDGHDIGLLNKTLANLKELKTPRVLHIITKKGNGLKKAEEDPCKFHGISVDSTINDKKTYSEIFGNWLLNTAKDNKKLVAITPAMAAGSNMEDFAKQYPLQYFDVGIAEQHAVTFAAGIATKGLKPVVAIYSTFLQRAYDQLIHDVALQNLPVIFAIDRAGIVGNDGATHSGSFDISFLLAIPGIIIMTPSSGYELYAMLNTAIFLNSPVCIRYPRAYTNADYISDNILNVGQAKIVLNGKNLVILAFGNMLTAAIEAANKIQATVVDMRFAKPIDKKLITSVSKTHSMMISIEENSEINGVGSYIAKFLHDKNIKIDFKVMGLSDNWVKQGTQEELYNLYNLNAKGIINLYEKNFKKII